MGIYEKAQKSFYYKDMHAYVHCSTIPNSKDMESTKHPSMIDLIKKMWYIWNMYHGILCSHKKDGDYILCRDMDGARSHYPQQTYTVTEKEMPHFLTYKCKLNDENTWTHREEQHTLGPMGGLRVGEGKGSGKTTNRQ